MSIFKKIEKKARVRSLGAVDLSAARISSLGTTSGWAKVMAGVTARIEADKEKLESSKERHARDLFQDAARDIRTRKASYESVPDQVIVAAPGDFAEMARHYALQVPNDRGAQFMRRASESRFKRTASKMVTMGEVRQWEKSARALTKQSKAVEAMVTDGLAQVATLPDQYNHLGRRVAEIRDQQSFEKVVAELGITSNSLEHRFARAYLAKRAQDELGKEAQSDWAKSPDLSRPVWERYYGAGSVGGDMAAVEGVSGVVFPQGQDESSGEWNWQLWNNDRAEVLQEGKASDLGDAKEACDEAFEEEFGHLAKKAQHYTVGMPRGWEIEDMGNGYALQTPNKEHGYGLGQDVGDLSDASVVKTIIDDVSLVPADEEAWQAFLLNGHEGKQAQATHPEGKLLGYVAQGGSLIKFVVTEDGRRFQLKDLDTDMSLHKGPVWFHINENDEACDLEPALDVDASKKAQMSEEGIDFEIQCEPEDLQIEGNVLASGDDAADKEAEDKVRQDLESGNQWAWCQVRVLAIAPDETTGESTWLGACSYTSEEDFKQPGGYYDDLKAEALADLESKKVGKQAQYSDEDWQKLQVAADEAHDNWTIALLEENKEKANSAYNEIRVSMERYGIEPAAFKDNPQARKQFFQYDPQTGMLSKSGKKAQEEPWQPMSLEYRDQELTIEFPNDQQMNVWWNGQEVGKFDANHDQSDVSRAQGFIDDMITNGLLEEGSQLPFDGKQAQAQSSWQKEELGSMTCWSIAVNHKGQDWKAKVCETRLGTFVGQIMDMAGDAVAFVSGLESFQAVEDALATRLDEMPMVAKQAQAGQFMVYFPNFDMADGPFDTQEEAEAAGKSKGWEFVVRPYTKQAQSGLKREVVNGFVENFGEEAKGWSRAEIADAIQGHGSNGAWGPEVQDKMGWDIEFLDSVVDAVMAKLGK